MSRGAEAVRPGVPPRGPRAPEPRRPVRLACLAALLCAALPGAASAHPGEDLHVHAFGEVGMRSLGGDGLLSLRPGVVFERPRLRLVLAPTVHLGLTPDTRRPRLRPEDHDELTDLGRVLAHFEAYDRGGRWSVRAGSLSFERLGHGTVVSDYVSALDPDHPHTGLRAHLSGERVRLELLAGEVLAPQVLAARVAWAPLGGDGLRLGATAASDLTAPVRLTGGVAPGRNPAADTAAVVLTALDADLTVWRGEGGALAPYVDAVVAAAGPFSGKGALHAGVLLDLNLAEATRLSVKGEARRLGRDFVPEYLDAYHTLERWMLPGGRPKGAGSGAPPAWGGRVELALELDGLGLLAVSGDARDVGPANAALHLGVRPPGPVSASLHLAHRGFPGVRGAFVDRGWLGLGEVRVEVGKGVWALLSGGRIQRVDAVSGRLVPAWDVGLAVGAGI